MEDTTDTTDTLHSEAINGLLASIINEITRLDDATGAYEQGVLITRYDIREGVHLGPDMRVWDGHQDLEAVK